jgi:hypothetical protein
MGLLAYLCVSALLGLAQAVDLPKATASGYLNVCRRSDLACALDQYQAIFTENMCALTGAQP